MDGAFSESSLLSARESEDVVALLASVVVEEAEAVLEPDNPKRAVVVGQPATKKRTNSSNLDTFIIL